MNDRPSSTPELFAAAIALAPPERERFLDDICTPGTSLRYELDLLIKSHEQAHDFLESPPIELVSAEAGVGAPDEDIMPSRLGAYTIIKQIGTGGMGRVYLAESEKPRRRVALKVIRPGNASTGMMRRFEQEAQVVALLQHPGIAQIFEASTATGPYGPQSYIAMEYVDGLQLTEYIKCNQLDMRAKISLFCRLCDAVMHAHQKGVIHRDLKPANIMVGHDGMPKVLDFGVARLVNPDVRSQSLHTHAGQLIGTLAYMSPEQVSGEPGTVDSRSDVYALGVLLYEILTGKLPHDINQSPIPEAIRIIREQTPTSLSILDREYRGDIETIVNKALEKEPERRYQSAKELADDLRRWLRDEPIIARRPGKWYQCRKFVKRNKALVGGTLTTFLVLIVGIASVVKFAREAQSSRDESRLLLVMMYGMIGTADPDDYGDADAAMLEAIERTSNELDLLAQSQPLVCGALHRQIGNVYRSRAQYDKSEAHFLRAYAIHSEHLGSMHQESLRSLTYLGVLYSECGKIKEGLALIEPIWTNVEKTFPETTEERVMLASAYASLLTEIGRTDDALPLARYALNERRAALGDTHDTTLNAQYAVARIYASIGELGKSLEIKRAIVDLHQQTGRKPTIRSVIWHVGLGNDLLESGKLNELGELLKTILPMAEQVFSVGHPGRLAALGLNGAYLAQIGQDAEAIKLLAPVVDQYRSARAAPLNGHVQALSTLAESLRKQGKLREAEDAFREAAILASPESGFSRRRFLIATNNLATFLRLQSRYDEALDYYAPATAQAALLLKSNDQVLAALRYGTAICLAKQDRFEESITLLLQSEEALRQAFSEDHLLVVTTRRTLVDVYKMWDKPEQAEQWMRRLDGQRVP